MKVRNPKAEGRRKIEVRSPKSEVQRLRAEDYETEWPVCGRPRTRKSLTPASWGGTDPNASAFGFRISAFLRTSDFGLRISPILLSLLVSQLSFAATTNPPSADAIPPLRPPRGEIGPTFWEQHGLWVALAGVLLLAVIAAAVWWLRRKRPPVMVPPYLQARQALEPLRQQAEDGAVLSRVSQILRRYVSAAFGLPPGEMTTAEFCRAIADQGRLGTELSTKLADFLLQCDERKFAPSAPAPGLDAAAQALKFIEVAEARRAELRPADEAPTTPQPPRAYRGASKA